MVDIRNDAQIQQGTEYIRVAAQAKVDAATAAAKQAEFDAKLAAEKVIAAQYKAPDTSAHAQAMKSETTGAAKSAEQSGEGLLKRVWNRFRGNPATNHATAGGAQVVPPVVGAPASSAAATAKQTSQVVEAELVAKEPGFFGKLFAPIKKGAAQGVESAGKDWARASKQTERNIGRGVQKANRTLMRGSQHVGRALSDPVGSLAVASEKTIGAAKGVAGGTARATRLPRKMIGIAAVAGVGALALSYLASAMRKPQMDDDMLNPRELGDVTPVMNQDLAQPMLPPLDMTQGKSDKYWQNVVSGNAPEKFAETPMIDASYDDVGVPARS